MDCTSKTFCILILSFSFVCHPLSLPVESLQNFSSRSMYLAFTFEPYKMVHTISNAEEIVAEATYVQRCRLSIISAFRQALQCGARTVLVSAVYWVNHKLEPQVPNPRTHALHNDVIVPAPLSFLRDIPC